MTSTVNPVKMAKNGDYLTLSEVEAYGEAPGVTWKLLSDIGGRQTYAVVFKIGDEIATGLLAFARAHDVKAAHFTGLGAAQDVKVAWYDLDRKEYKVITVDGNVEILSLVGNIARSADGIIVHSHLVVGHEDGSTRGGHLLHATVHPTLEVMLTVEPAALQKVYDDSIGLALFDLSK
jgi:predicted DNA-binding protein with PD1-like motif